MLTRLITVKREENHLHIHTFSSMVVSLSGTTSEEDTPDLFAIGSSVMRKINITLSKANDVKLREFP